MDQTPQPTEESLDFADRWMRNALTLLQPPSSYYQTTIDVTSAMERLDRWRKEGVTATLTPMIVQAVAKALASRPNLHQLVAGDKRIHPERVDIGLSVTGEHFLDPVVVIPGADQKTISELVTEISTQAPVAREANQRLLKSLRTWGRFVPFEFLRKLILKRLYNNPHYRRQLVGTFQVTTVPVECAYASAYMGTGVLVAGAVRARVIAVNGEAVVRPTMIVTLSADHGVWDGRAAAQFLAAVKSDLETPVSAETIRSAVKSEPSPTAAPKAVLP